MMPNGRTDSNSLYVALPQLGADIRRRYTMNDLMMIGMMVGVGIFIAGLGIYVVRETRWINDMIDKCKKTQKDIETMQEHDETVS